jgi:hypothetical protein
MQIDIPEGYESLGQVLQLAVDQAAKGKGLSRHASGEPFDQQKICRISRAVGVGFALGQAEKKIEESARLPVEAALHELLGAINYTAAGYIVTAESRIGPCCSHVAGSLADIVGVKV